MPRPCLPVGTWGKIRRKQYGPGRWQARARFRDYDGHTRDVEAWAATGAAAERHLLEMLRDRATPTGDDITRDTRISQLAQRWLDEIRAEDRLTPQTIDKYETSLRVAILPALGHLRLREATVSRLDRCFKTIATDYPSKARHAKSTLGQVMAMAVRHDAIPTNPVRDVGRLRKPRRRVQALTIDDLHTVRAAIAAWQQPGNRPGPRHTADLADIIDLLLATGARIGEILALRWKDLNLGAAHATATFSGTLVYVKGKGYYRQPWTKTNAGYRTLTLPRFATDLLLRRQVNATGNPDAIFCSRRGTWLSPHNVRRQWREARKDAGLEWVTPHTFRKTVATLLDREADTKTAAAQLGHSSEEITSTYYIEKANQAPDVSAVLQVLGAHGGGVLPSPT
jgi:integrase